MKRKDRGEEVEQSSGGGSGGGPPSSLQKQRQLTKRQCLIAKETQQGTQLFAMVEQGDPLGEIAFSCFSQSRFLNDNNNNNNNKQREGGERVTNFMIGLRDNPLELLITSFQSKAPSLLVHIQKQQLQQQAAFPLPSWYRLQMEGQHSAIGAFSLKGFAYDLEEEEGEEEGEEGGEEGGEEEGVEVRVTIQEILDPHLVWQLTKATWPPAMMAFLQQPPQASAPLLSSFP
jgi:hypothetical protein